MIDSFYYIIGFGIYTLFNTSTLYYFNKTQKSELKTYGYFMIFTYYTLLMAYIIDTIENDGFFEKAIQITFYGVSQGIFLFFFYKNILKPQKQELYN